MLNNSIMEFPSTANSNTKENQIAKGQIWIARLTGEGHIQSNIRPIIVYQNNMASKYSSIITIVPLSSKINKVLPTHVFLSKSLGLNMNSIALCEQIQTINKSQLIEFTGVTLSNEYMRKIFNGILIQLGEKIN